MRLAWATVEDKHHAIVVLLSAGLSSFSTSCEALVDRTHHMKTSADD